MNIWIVNHYAIPPSMGGLVRHYYFSKYLQKKGHNVKIFTSSKIHNTDINMIQGKLLYKEQMMDGVEYTFVRSRDYKGNGLDRIWNMIDLPFKMWKSMKVFYKQKKPDVIYTSSPDLFVAFFALLFGKKHKVPVVVEVRDLWPESIVAYNKISSGNIIIFILYRLEKWIYTKADRIIFTMQGGQDYIREKRWDHIVDMKKIFNINNGLDLEEYEKNKNMYTTPVELLDDTDCFKVVYVGSIRKANGVGKILDIAKSLEDRGFGNIHFLIWGEGSEKEYLEKQCTEKNIMNVHFYGKVDKKYIPDILSRGDINFMHGITTPIMRYGCSPNKLFDYIGSGKPIVSDLAANYDLIKEHELGISVKNPTVKNMVEAFVEITRDYDKYSELADSNSKKLMREYDYQSLSERLEKVLDF